MPEHFVQPPQWNNVLVIAYFFLVGIVGGSYALGTLLRLGGDRRDEPAARLGFLISFPVLLICPFLLIFDLGSPLRFWHMLIDSRTGIPVLKYWSPLSLGSWGLVLFGIFSAISFIDAAVEQWGIRQGKWLHRIFRGGFGRAFMIVGAILGVFLASYIGLDLSVSNQPVWSDTWTIGGLFLASGLATAAATLGMFAWYGRDAKVTTGKLSEVLGYFILLQLVLLALFFITLGSLAARVLTGGWLVLWFLVLLGIVVPLAVRFRPAWERQVPPVISAGSVLLGVLALKAVVLFPPQS